MSERSEQIGDLISALAKAQSEFTAALKDSNNPYYNSKYADLATIIAATKPALTKHGIAVVDSCSSDIEKQVAIVTVSLHFGEQFISATGEAPAIGKGKDGNIRFDAQTIGAAWTYLRRYLRTGILGLASEDDDGNSLVTEQPVAPPPAKVAIPRSTLTSDQIMDIKEAFEESATLEEWNANIVPLMKERGKEFIILAAEEAKRRGYLADRTTGLYTVRRAQ